MATESNSFYLTDTDKILLEILCEKLIEDLDSFLKWMGSNQQNSANNDRKKELLKSLIFSNEQNRDTQLYEIMDNQIVRVPLSFFFIFSNFYSFSDFRATFLRKPTQIFQ